MRNKTIYFLGGLFFLLGIGYLLYPLSKDLYKAEWSSETLEAKANFLKQTIAKADSNQPNIILLLADDLGYHDISLNGSQFLQTKHIDAMAKEGVYCSKAYVSSPVCSPSRAGMMTGRYQQRFGFQNQLQPRYLANRLEYFGFKAFVNSYPWDIKWMNPVPNKQDIKEQGLPPTEITLAELLKKQGYATGMIGKWHLGSAPYSVPHKRGFDYHYGFYASHSLFAPEGTEGVVDLHNEKDWTDSYIWEGQRNGNHAVVRNGEVIEETAYLTNRFTEEAVQFIEQNKDNPFFLYVPFSSPHTPLQAPEEYYNKFAHIKDPVKRIYNAMIASLDDAIGVINNKVKELGLAENTLIIFLSDNGGAAYTHATDNKPLKGGKVTTFEGGLRVPFFMQWDKKLKADYQYDNVISSLDVFTTICAVANVELPKDRVYDGVNLLPYIQGEIEGKPHQELYWKAGVTRTVLKDNYKLIFTENGTQQMLYNLEEDPYEKNDLAPQFPKQVAALKQAHFEWSKDFPKADWPAVVRFAYNDGKREYYFDN